MNTKRLGLVLFLTLVAGVAAAAITHTAPGSPQTAPAVQNAGIPRIVVTAKRLQTGADDCDTQIPRVVVVGRRVDAGQIAAVN